MLKARDYRQRAWRALGGKWGILAVTYLLVMLVTGVCSGLSFIGIGAALLIILGGPIQYGLAVQSQNVVRGRAVDVNDVLAAKTRFADTIVAYLLNTIFTFLWTLLFIIPGIIAAYSYSMTYYIMLDNPNLTPDQARKESIRLMTGNKWRLFCLHCSFIGWFLLCVLTLGILTIWISPYVECATAEFYDTLIPPRPTVENIGETVASQNKEGTNSTIDPFDHSGDQTVNTANAADTANTASTTTAGPNEQFYVFEEERPREANNPDNGDSNISGN